MGYSEENTDIEFPYHLLSMRRGSSRLEALGEQITFPKNYELNKIDKVSDYCYIVKSGHVIAYEYLYSGEQRIYNVMIPGAVFLEECILYRTPCPVLFKTLTPSVLIRIDRCSLIRAFKRDIDVVMDICESISIKFLSAMEQLRFEPSLGATWKLCKLFLTLATHYGKPCDGYILIKEKYSQQMLADLLGINRVTVTRKIKKLKDEGLIGIINGCYCIYNMKQFKEYMTHIELS